MAVAVERDGVVTGAVTAPKGFVAGAVHAGIRKAKLDLAVVRSTVPAVGAGMFTANRVQAAPVLVSKAHLAQAEPQAVVINSGVANAATGKQGELDALATAAETARAARARAGAGARPLDRRDRREAADAEAARRPRTRSSSPPTAAPRRPRRSSPPTRRPKEALVSRGGFTVGGMAKGAGMIHPCLATMLAVVTTDYPLAAGEAHGVPQARRRARASTGSRSTASARRTTR